jgi:excisionase family DNA binding protein
MADSWQSPRTEVNMMIQFESEAFVTPEEAAEFLRYSPITVKRLAREGKIPALEVGVTKPLARGMIFSCGEASPHS